MKFVKMHGLGNDYVYLDAVSEPGIASRVDLAVLARAMSSRHRGVGSDGLILVCSPTAAGVARGAKVRMRMFNADGTESEMCGNGVRCVAKFAHDRLGMKGSPLAVETGRGVLAIDVVLGAEGRVASATVDMGEPILEPAKVPVDVSKLTAGSAPGRFVIPDAKGLPEIMVVSMGNPHVVIFDERPLKLPEVLGFMQGLGPRLERHPAFPQRANIHLAHAISKTEGFMVTWERGAGITQACGTGACAVLVAGVMSGRFDRAASLRLPGGVLDIRWDEWSQHVFMTGPAEEVFEGVWPDQSVPPSALYA